MTGMTAPAPKLRSGWDGVIDSVADWRSEGMPRLP